MSAPPPVAIRPAATVVLLRDSAAGVETLLLRRHGNLAFAGGQWVFPGGAIDPADFADAPDDVAAAARRAAAREAYEEAGLTLDPAGFDYIGHWTTPADGVRRYATWFYATRFAGPATVVVDDGEIAEHCWLGPRQALERHREGRLAMLPPTFVTLTEIVDCANAAEALAVFRARPPLQILAKPCRTADGRCLLYPGDAGYESGDPSRPGPRHRTSITPTGWRYEREDC